MMKARSTHVLLLSSLMALLGFSNAASAATIANWKALSTPPPDGLAGLNTDSPTFGDGTAEDADALVGAGLFGTDADPATVTLSVGETLTVTGTLNLTGGNSSLYRFGVLNDGGQFALDDRTNWDGGWIHSIDDDLFRARTDGSFASVGGNAEDLNAAQSTAGSFNGDSTLDYTFSMSITRDSATTVNVVSSIIGGDNSFSQEYIANDITTDQFTYNAFGFFFSNDADLDQAAFTNVQYNTIPEPSSITYLFCLAAVVGFGFLRNRR